MVYTTKSSHKAISPLLSTTTTSPRILVRTTSTTSPLWPPVATSSRLYPEPAPYALQIGVLAPEPTPTGHLFTGQVGYVILGIKTTKAARVGDTLHAAKKPVEQLPGFKAAKSMVYAGTSLLENVQTQPYILVVRSGVALIVFYKNLLFDILWLPAIPCG